MKHIRSERKFFISAKEKQEIEKLISYYCKKDSHGENGFYRVSSIYFDDKYLKSYHEKFNGDFEKTKYRLRYYNGDLSTLRGEVKKKRGQITEKQFFNFQDTSSLFSVITSKKNIFSQIVSQKSLRPVIHVNYLREAYIADSNEDIRITFDSELTFKTNPTELKEQNLSLYDLSYFIMEIKYHRQSYWIANLLAELTKREVSFSKYYNILSYHG